MANTPESEAIREIVDLTTIRDIELLELSLLKSLANTLNANHAAKYSWSDSSNDIQATIYQSDHFIGQTALQTLPKSISDSLTQNPNDEHCITTTLEEGVQTIFFLSRETTHTVIITTLTPQPISAGYQRVLEGILQIYTNYQSLLAESQQDKLTGLANRSIFDDYLHQLIARMPALNEDLKKTWIAIIDVDHFKAINDNHGHLIGDEVLVVLANLLRNKLNPNDKAFRVGGEEFVIIINEQERGSTEEQLESLRASVASHKFPQIGSITISIGVMGISQRALPATLFDYADKALYESKHRGRNQVTFFDDMLKDGRHTLKDVEAGSIELF